MMEIQEVLVRALIREDNGYALMTIFPEQELTIKRHLDAMGVANALESDRIWGHIEGLEHPISPTMKDLILREMEKMFRKLWQNYEKAENAIVEVLKPQI